MQDDPQSNNQITTHIGDNASRVIVGKQITHIEAENVYLQAAPAPVEPPTDWANIEARYRAQVVTHYNKLALTGLPERDPSLHELALEKIFVKLSIELPQPAKQYFVELEGSITPHGDLRATGKDVTRMHQSKEEDLRRDLYRPATQRRPPEPVTLSVTDALQRYPHLVVIGGPGSGKTTLTRWLAVIFAQQKQADPANLGSPFATDRLPILLELRRFADRFTILRRQPTVPDLAEVIATSVSNNPLYPDTPEALIRQALAEGRCLVLLDGLDEITNRGARQMASEAIYAFLHHPDAHYRDNLLVVTVRPYGYQGVGLANFQECKVKPFAPTDVQAFIRHWYATAYGDLEYPKANELIDTIKANERVNELANNPLLCTIILIVYHKYDILPSRRVELYLKCCEALLFTWEQAKTIVTLDIVGHQEKWETALKLLEPLAFWLHDKTERLAAPMEDFVDQLAPELQKQEGLSKLIAEERARRFLFEIRDRSGLLQDRGDGTLEFVHPAFQEYLTARYIAAQPDYIDLVMKHLHKAWWREVHLLVIGYLGSSNATAEHNSRLLLTILDAVPLPWPGLRSFSLNGAIRRWRHRFASYQSAQNRWFEFIVRLSTGSLLLPYQVVRFGANCIPQWQLDRRLAWVLQRELNLVVEGFLDCTTVGVTLEVEKQLVTIIIQWFSRSVFDPIFVIDSFTLPHQQCGRLLQRCPQLRGKLLPILLVALRNPDWFVRKAAVDVLEQLEQESVEVVVALLATLRDPEESVRKAAADVLERLEQGNAEIVAVLLATLRDPDDPNEYVHTVAVNVLGQMKQSSTEVVFAMLDALCDPEVSVREAAANTLGKLGHSKSEVVVALLAALRDPEVSVREAAANVLMQLEQASSEVLVVLHAALRDPNDPNGYIQAVAGCALSRMGEGNTEVVAALFATFRNPEGYVRAIAVDALRHIAQANVKVVTDLLAMLHNPNDPDAYEREAAANVLGQLKQGNTEALATQLAAFRDPNDSDAYVRVAAADVLLEMKQSSAEVVTVLCTSLRHPNWFVRAVAADSLRHVGQGNAEVVTAPLAVLCDPVWFVRIRAAFTLAELGEDNAETMTILLAALRDPEESVREAAASALGRMKGSSAEVVVALLVALRDPEESVREAAASALGRMKGSSAEVVVALLVALRDPEESVRIAAAGVLGRLEQDSTEVVTALLAALRDPKKSVYYAAAIALGRLRWDNSEAVFALFVALRDPEESVRVIAAGALLKQLEQGSPEEVVSLVAALRDLNWFIDSNEVVIVLLTALRDSRESVREAAAAVLGHLGKGSTEVVTALLAALRDSKEPVYYASARALGQLEINEPAQRRKILIALNQRLHLIDDHKRTAAFRAIRRLTKGSQAAGHWIPLGIRVQRQRRIQRIGWWAFALCTLLLVALSVVVVADRLDANSLLLRWGIALAAVTGLLASVAQLIGRSLRNPFDGEG